MAEAIDLLETSLQERDVRVTRQPCASDYGTDEMPANAFQELEIEIALRGEEVDVRRRSVVRESVVVTKYLRERAIPFRESVRRERLDIDGGAKVEELDDRRLDRSHNGRMHDTTNHTTRKE